MTVNEILNNITSVNKNFETSTFKEWYHQQPTAKGATGEKIVSSLLESLGMSVEKRESREHDLIVNGKKVEIKTAFESADNTFVFYGYDASTDPHYWLLSFVTHGAIYVVKMDRKAMAEVYLGKSRKNSMFTLSLEQAIDVGELVVIYEDYPHQTS